MMESKLEYGRNWICQLIAREDTPSNCGQIRCDNGDCQFSTSYYNLPLALCVCDPGWIGRECDLCCDLPCVEGRGECRWDYNENIPFCSCNLSLNYTGVLCEEEYITDSTDIHESTENLDKDARIAAIVSSVLAVVIIICIILATYRLLKQRPPWLQHYLIKHHTRNHDNGHQKFDVFISYRTSDKEDRKFVTDSLLPYLEKKQISVCIDERDFIPGIAIKTNIEEAIRNSKRTILVISPAFVQGIWPEFEVQCALLESLRKNKLVIPIIHKPIAAIKETLSESLNHILNGVLCIEWSDEEKKQKLFWNFLATALPPATTAVEHGSLKEMPVPDIV